MEYQPTETNSVNGGTQDIYRFEGSSHGASVVQHEFSYGGDKGLWELAVTHYTGDTWEICYCTSVTDDVIGHLSDIEVQETLSQIDALGQTDCTCPTIEERLTMLRSTMDELRDRNTKC